MEPLPVHCSLGNVMLEYEDELEFDDELNEVETLLEDPGHSHSGTTLRKIGRSIAHATGVSNMLTNTNTRLWYAPKDPSCDRTFSNSYILELLNVSSEGVDENQPFLKIITSIITCKQYIHSFKICVIQVIQVPQMCFIYHCFGDNEHPLTLQLK